MSVSVFFCCTPYAVQRLTAKERCVDISGDVYSRQSQIHSTAEMGYFNGAYFTSAKEPFITHQQGITLRRDPLSFFRSLDLNTFLLFKTVQIGMQKEFNRYDYEHIEHMPHSVSLCVNLPRFYLPECFHSLLSYTSVLKLRFIKLLRGFR